MGVYAAWFAGTFDANLRIAHPPAAVPLERTLLLADFEPPAALVESFLGGIPRYLALPAPPEQPLPGVVAGCFRTGSNPIWFDETLQDAFRGGVDVVAFLCPPSAIHGKTLLWLHEHGVKRVVYPARGRNRSVAPKRLAYERLLVNAPKRLLQRVGLSGPATMTRAQCQSVIANAPPARAPSAGKLKIAHFICALNSGGAERQVCYAAIGQKKLGHDVRVFCRQSPVGVDGHYLSLLDGIPARRIGARWSDDFAAHCGRPPRLDALPPDLRQTVADMLGELLALRPDVLHCYVDDCNIPGAIAGLLAGTPAIALSFRNGNPSLFPGLEMPWMKPWYQALRDHPSIQFSSNSAGGARDYEAWLGWPNETPVIRNAFEPPALPSAEDANAWRRSLNIPPEAPLVAGVFRLEAEKRPLHFLDCVDRLRRLVPDVRVVHAGVGALETAMREKVKSLSLEDTVLILGQRRDIPTLLSASDVLLLVSSWEGTPNVALEAQYCGCVPVLTDVGGSAEAIDPASSGVLVGRDDLAGAVDAVDGLLRDPSRRATMAAAGRAFLRANFSPEALTDANLRMYESILSRQRLGATGSSGGKRALLESRL